MAAATFISIPWAKNRQSEGLVDAIEATRNRRQEQLLFATEEPEDVGLGNSGPVRDRFRRGAMQPFQGKFCHSSFQYFVSALLCRES